MPVLDAKALKTDPKGTAFLRGVLRPGPTAHLKAEPKPGRGQIDMIKHRAELFDRASNS